MSFMPKVAEVVSRVSIRSDGSLSHLGRLIVGSDHRIVPVVWRVSPTHPTGVLKWAEFVGDQGATRLPWPARYRRVGCVAVDVAVLGENAPDQGQLALAYKFDAGTVMTGVVPEQDPAEAFKGNRCYMRIGRGPAAFAVGFVGEANAFSVAPESFWAERNMPLTDPSLADVPIY